MYYPRSAARRDFKRAFNAEPDEPETGSPEDRGEPKNGPQAELATVGDGSLDRDAGDGVRKFIA
jgi:hypothetical protein